MHSLQNTHSSDNPLTGIFITMAGLCGSWYRLRFAINTTTLTKDTIMRLIPITDPAVLAVLDAQLEEDFIQQEALKSAEEYIQSLPKDYTTIPDDVPF